MLAYLFHNIGSRINSNYNTPEEVAASDGFVTFDGIYLSVHAHRSVLRGKSGILFVTGAYVGKDNSFDSGMPLERYCTWDQIVDIAQVGHFAIGWHTWSHPDLTRLDEQELARELRPPFPMKHFAYPYGRFNSRVIEAVKLAGFAEAWTVHQGDGSAFQRNRSYLHW